MQLGILIGIPGSGKSTLAHQLLTDGHVNEIHSSDAIRRELFGQEEPRPDHIAADNTDVFTLLRSRVEAALIVGRTPLVDATNLRPEFRAQWLDLAKRYNCPGVAWLLDVPFSVCQARNCTRSRVVPPEVMAAMFHHYQTFCVPHLLVQEGWETVHLERYEC